MRRHHWIGWLLVAILLGLILVLEYGSRFGDEALRRKLEATMNQQMHGYTVQLGHAHGGPLRLSLTLRDVVIRQIEHPEPPVARIARLRMRVEWHELLARHLVGDATFDQPRLHLDIDQLHAERVKQMKLGIRGWQAALQSIYPLKFNTMKVNDGSLTYVDSDLGRPFEIDRWTLTATNIRNLQFPDRVYPSPVHTEGRIFGSGYGVVDGNANFLADPFPAWHARYRVEKVPLDPLGKIPRVSYELHGGTLSSHGVLEYGPRFKLVEITEALFENVRYDYVHSTATAEAERRHAEEVKKFAEEAESSPIALRVDRLRLTGGQVGYINRASNPPYRLYVDRANLELLNMANRAADHSQTAVLKLRGRFMGGGSAKGDATFLTGSPVTDLGVELAVEHANLPAFNDVLRAYKRPDAAGGTVSIYSQITVKNRQIHGYVKAMFDDVKLYDAQKDRKKSFGTKLKEKLMGGLAELMENKKSDAMVLRTEVSGSLDAPRTSTSEMLGSMLRNAFGQAIEPGFDRAAKKGKG
ncbi:MAG: DUF748 domain-containing protein [Acidobacteria bacterium]|nr:DUF748 domain-containing protein [Acidobacteriota bacterium]